MKSIKIFLASLILMTTPAFAVSTGTDHSDIWWNASESGWGVNIVQQERTLFATMFVYGSTGTPTWYSGALDFVSTNAGGDSTFTGKLNSTTGTPINTLPFVSGSTVYTEVGTITFVGLANGSGALSYTINGTTYTKNITRTTFAQPAPATPNVATAYRGATSSVASGFPSPGDNGTFNNDIAQFAIYISGSQMRFEVSPGGGVSCTFTGSNYIQEGRYGKVILSGRCSDDPAGFAGTISAREIHVGATTFSMLYRFSNNANSGVETGTWIGAKK